MARLTALALLLSLSLSVEAAPRDFTWTFDSQTLEAGKAEAVLLTAARTGRRDYHARFELAGGGVIAVTRSLEAWLLAETSFQHDGLNWDVAASGHLTAMFKHRFLAPENPLGFAVLAKVSAGLDDGLLGARFVVDRRIAGVRLALNAAVEKTVFFRGQSGVDLRAEETVAMGYRLKNSVTPSLEFLAQQSLAGSEFKGAAFFVAASLTSSFGWGWVSLGVVTQVAAVKPDADVGDGEKLELRDHERYGFRFAVGANAL